MLEEISVRHQRMYMRIAEAVAAAGTCDRAQVGSVLVRHSAILGTGYNGASSGDTHCDHVGHIMVGGHCQKAVHSEENAILNAAKLGVSTYGATLFCTHRPCYRCMQRLINAGIKRVYYKIKYGNKTREQAALESRAKMEVICLGK